MLTDPIGRVRAAGLLEGVSLLLLLGVAMPLKYLADQPEAVRVVGWCHGILFIFYCLTVALAFAQRRLAWPLALLAFVAAFVPFGPFLLDARLKRAEAASPA